MPIYNTLSGTYKHSSNDPFDTWTLVTMSGADARALSLARGSQAPDIVPSPADAPFSQWGFELTANGLWRQGSWDTYVFNKAGQQIASDGWPEWTAKLSESGPHYRMFETLGNQIPHTIKLTYNKSSGGTFTLFEGPWGYDPPTDWRWKNVSMSLSTTAVGTAPPVEAGIAYDDSLWDTGVAPFGNEGFGIGGTGVSSQEWPDTAGTYWRVGTPTSTLYMRRWFPYSTTGYDITFDRIDDEAWVYLNGVYVGNAGSGSPDGLRTTNKTVTIPVEMLTESGEQLIFIRGRSDRGFRSSTSYNAGSDAAVVSFGVALTLPPEATRQVINVRSRFTYGRT